MPDPFSCLPLPLPLFILNRLEDLGTLHYILQSSPAASAIFAEYYCEITESILSNFVPLLQRILRTVVYTRCQPANIKAQCDTVQAFDIFRATHFLGADAGPTPLRKSTTTFAAVRSLAVTASQVQSLSASFFVTHLDRVNKIRPYCTIKAETYIEDQWAMVPGPGHVQYDIIPCEEPSWIEEQRVLRALWRIVIYFDLLGIVRPKEDQESEVWDSLVLEGPRRLWWTDRHVKRRDLGLAACHMQEMDCVFEFLCETSGMTTTSGAPATSLQTLPAIELNASSILKPTPSSDPIAKLWCRLPPELRNPSPAYTFYINQQILKAICTLHNNAIRHTNKRPTNKRPRKEYDWASCEYSFDHLRYLGMSMWDQEKLARLGLTATHHLPSHVEGRYLLGPHRTSPGAEELFIRWRSIANGDRVVGNHCRAL